MRAELTLGGALGLGLVGLGALALYELVKHRAALVAAVNPADQANLVNKAASAGVKAATGGAAAGGEDSIGGVFARFREWVSGDTAKINALKAGAPAVDTSSSASSAPPSATDLADYYGAVGP